MTESQTEKASRLVGMLAAFLLIAAVSSILHSVLDIPSHRGPSQALAQSQRSPESTDPNQPLLIHPF